MGDKTGISWTDATWNVFRGCSIVSPGCTNCYAMKAAYRYSGEGMPYEGLAEKRNGHAIWTGEVRLVEHLVAQPLRWTKPRRIFVNSMSDLFHENVPDEWLDRIFDVMERATQHTFQVLTKRPERMREYMYRRYPPCVRLSDTPFTIGSLPPPNIWVGVSVEDQRRADERIPYLLDTPAAVRFLSAEPLLGNISIANFGLSEKPNRAGLNPGIHWVIVGGESGPRRRPMDLAWAESIRDQCEQSDAAFFFKQVSNLRSGVGADALGQTYHDFPVAVSR